MRTVARPYCAGMHGTFLWDHDDALLEFLRGDEPALFAVWHQDFVHTIAYLARFNPRRRTHVLTSASRDGGLAAAAAEGVGFRPPIRGSSARGGHEALLAMHRLLERDPHASLAVVCDGPRPPARVLKPGIVHLAEASGRPLWLVRTSFARRTELRRSWARFQLPHPGSHAVIRALGPIHIPPTTDRSGFEAKRRGIEARLNALADATDARAAAIGRRPRRGLANDGDQRASGAE